jgi:uncharacterized membrane protein
MKQDVFIDTLRRELGSLPKAAIDEIVADYREYIGDARAAGRNEEEVIAALGDPVKLARELKAQASYKQWEAQRSFGNLMRVVASVAGLGLLQLLLLGPFLLYLLILTAGYIVSGALTVAGLVAVVALGCHHLFGTDLNLKFGNDTKTKSTDLVGDLHTDFAGLQVLDKRFVLRLNNGAHVDLVTSAGPIELKRSAQGQLDMEIPDAAARKLLTQNPDGSFSIDRDAVNALDFNDTVDGRLSLARNGENKQELSWDIVGKDGSHASFEQDANGDTQNLSVHDNSDNSQVTIGNGEIAVDDNEDHIHISGLGGTSLESIALRYAFVVLPIGLLGLLLCIWLTRITWRALARFTQRQIDALSTSFGHTSAR